MYGRIAEMTMRLEHRHGDGSWNKFERVPHDAAEYDPERDWAKGETLYLCTRCDEIVRVTTDQEAGGPASGE
jgi:hypothetical protein